jgi:signal transduction histidine kinase
MASLHSPRQGRLACRILLVDADDDAARRITRALRGPSGLPCGIERVTSAAAAGRIAADFDVVLLSPALAGAWEAEGPPDPPVLLIAGPAHTCRTVREVVERRRTGQALRSLRAELFDQAALAFRTPLTAALGTAGPLPDGDLGPLEPAAAPLVAISAGNLMLLRALAGAPADPSVARDGELTACPRRCSVTAIVTPVIDALMPLAERRRVRLSCHRGDDGLVLADPERITQVLANLVANAVESTPRGGVVTLIVKDDPGGGVAFAVEDDGAGIPPEALPHLFERPFQASEADASSGHRGLGLGLFIARELVRAHGGELTVQARRPAGSRVGFALASR